MRAPAAFTPAPASRSLLEPSSDEAPSIGEHDVVIPVNQLKMTGGKIILSGATKELIRAMPRFEYTPK